ncbi:hypothetical protein [Sphingomonas faeni]|uniref:hypothetical protein n=1 Tax=Sphingomonas faeni TaxID=185950 RepID=UPI0027D809E8|nr:hypothetical protein [Sphingomonas faeni]
MPDQRGGIIVVDRNGGRALESLLGIEQIEAGISALVDPEAYHVDYLTALLAEWDVKKDGGIPFTLRPQIRCTGMAPGGRGHGHAATYILAMADNSV